MPEPYPIPLGARVARREHDQTLVCIPKRLVARWAIGRNTHLYFTLVDDTTVMIQKLEPTLPGRPLTHDDPRRNPVDDAPHPA